MIAIEAKELWRQIPPEEKIELMSIAHGKGFLTAIVNITVMSTLAVALQQPWMLWTSLIITPMIFQLAAFKAWRMLRPKLMLEHLAARSAARRYAFSHRAQDLGVVTVFRGEVEEKAENEESLERAIEQMEAAVERNSNAATWIALFNDCVVALSERKGGASLRMAHLINKKLSLTSASEDGKDYSNEREVVLTMDEGDGKSRSVKITSRYPAALIVFEKKLQALLAVAQNKEDIPLDGASVEFNALFDQIENQ